MGFRVAVASSDGKFINQHFGHAKQFLIFEIDEKTSADFQFLEVRNNTPVCSHQHHDEDRLRAVIDQLIDCKVVLASQIGPGAQTALEASNIMAYSMADFIEPALKRIAFHKYKRPIILRSVIFDLAGTFSAIFLLTKN